MQASNPTAGPSTARSSAEIAAQIAALQAELAAAESARVSKPTREQQEAARVLVQHSPSPKKKKARTEPVARPARPSYELSAPLAKAKAKEATPVDLLTDRKPERPSNILRSLDVRRSKLKDAEERRGMERSTGFSVAANAPLPKQMQEGIPEDDSYAQRDESLALIEKLEMGPKEFAAPGDDPQWQKVEPNSKIRLRQRLISHQDMQEHMHMRYHISPSLLYSIVRPGRSGSELEVPVEGDFVIIGVLAEKSDIRMQAKQPAPVKPDKKKKKQKEPADREDADELQDSEPEEAPEKRQPKRFVMFKLLDMRYSRGQSTSAGDGVLTVFLFEANSSQTLYELEQDQVATTSTGARVRQEAQEQQKTTLYKGGSGGAYEKFCKESNGTVVAIVNPRVLKPRQPGKPHPNSNTLAITPESADSVLILGRAQDLGSCQALKKDGRPCGSWCDLRTAEYCDYHIQQAVEKKRSGRSELMIGTSSLTSSVGGRGGKKPNMGQRYGGSIDYDPSRKTGLLPKSGKMSVQGVTTYVTGGSKNVRRTNGNVAGFAVPSEKKEREEAQDRKRKREAEEKVLMGVLRKDGGKTLGAKYLKSVGSVKDEPGEEEEVVKRPKVFDAASLRAIGYDPTRNDKSINHGEEDADAKKKRLEIVNALDFGSSTTVPKLGRAPTPKEIDLGSEDEDDLVVLREGELQPKARAKVRWQMHAKKFAPKNGPTAASAPIDHDAQAETAPVASTSKVAEAPKAKSKPMANKKRKKGAATFKSGTEGEVTGGDSLASLMANFQKKGGAQ